MIKPSGIGTGLIIGLPKVKLKQQKSATQTKHSPGLCCATSQQRHPAFLLSTVANLRRLDL